MRHAILLCLAVLTSADASVVGTVRDAGGLLLPGATVTLIDGRGQRHSPTCGDDGGFSFAGIPAGRYGLQVTFPGFEAYEEFVQVDDAPTRPLRIILSLSRLREDVAVRAL